MDDQLDTELPLENSNIVQPQNETSSYTLLLYSLRIFSPVLTISLAKYECLSDQSYSFHLVAAVFRYGWRSEAWRFLNVYARKRTPQS